MVCGVKMNTNTVVELPMASEHYAKFLPEMALQTENFDTKELSGDTAYSSRKMCSLF
jgi:hypothetical protein